MVERLHFGGRGLGAEGAEEEEQEDFFTMKKNREQVYEEIILKSKLRKAEQLEQNEENAALVEELDGAFLNLLPLLEQRGHGSKRQKLEDADESAAKASTKRLGQKSLLEAF